MKRLKRLMIFDNSEKSFVGVTWKVGAKLLSPRFDTILACTSWDDCLTKLKRLEATGTVYDAVQFWGHGSPGNIYVGGKVAPDSLWVALSGLVRNTSTVWLRVCSFFAKENGKAAGNAVAAILGCRLLAHTHEIGKWACQSGLRAIVAPDKMAKWPDNEGGGGTKSSAPWLANTVSALQVSEPKWPSNQ